MRVAAVRNITINFSRSEEKRILAINKAAGFNIYLFAGEHEAAACPLDRTLCCTCSVRGVGQVDLVTYRKAKVVYHATYVKTAPQEGWRWSISEKSWWHCNSKHVVIW